MIDDDQAVAIVEVEEAELSPEELAAQEEEARLAEEEQRKAAFERLNGFGQSLAKTRAEAISGRQQSGIEEIWREDEEHYEGIDDANRGEHRTNWRTKPPGQAAPKDDDDDTKSTVFPNITGPFCDAAAARISDMLLPTDDRAWSLGPTPIPEMGELADGKPAPGMVAEAEQQYPGEPQKAESALAQAVADATRLMEEARSRADKAQTRIEDWHVECQYHAQVRLVIEDSARIGTGILKGPTPHSKTRWVWKLGQMQRVSEIKPGSKRIDPWNFYPDPACGESIHNGSYTWEKDSVTKRQLRDLKNDKFDDGTPVYIHDQIDECLREGPSRAEAVAKERPDVQSDPEDKEKFEIWYYHGTAEKEDIEAAGCECAEGESFAVMVTMVNNRVIRVSRNPLDTDEFPYDVMVWRRRDGHWSGTGVSRQIRTPQRMLVASTRHLMDNAGLAGGPLLIFRKGVVAADNKPMGIGPRRVYMIAEDADEVQAATDAIGYVKIDMMIQELLELIQLSLKLAEDVTGLPMLLQGQMGKAPDTVGGMTILNNNASATLRRLARLFDDRITEPHVRRYYHWLLQYGNDDEKGDYCIDARGSSALVQRDLQNQQIPQMLQLSTNPVFGWDPKKAADEFLKSLHLDPERFKFDDEKWQKIVENMAKGPQDPRLAVAQLRAETDQKLKQMEQGFEQAENQKQREHELLIEAVQAELERAAETGENTRAFANIKQKLADSAMKLRVQRELSVRNAVAKQVSKPPTEPRGRAKPGRAYQA